MVPNPKRFSSPLSQSDALMPSQILLPNKSHLRSHLEEGDSISLTEEAGDSVLLPEEAGDSILLPEEAGEEWDEANGISFRFLTKVSSVLIEKL